MTKTTKTQKNNPQKLDFFDLHAHYHLLNDFDFENDKLLQNNDAKINKILITSASFSDWQDIINLPITSKNIYKAIGIHPYDAHFLQNTNNTTTILEQLEATIETNQITAIAEIGLDTSKPDFQAQKQLFINQINIANNLHLPIIIHCHKAFHELIPILKSSPPRYNFAIHNFAESQHITLQLLERNAYFSFGLKLLNPNKISKIQQTITLIPPTQICLESDTTPQNLRSLPINTLLNNLNSLADILDLKTQQLATVIYKNTHNLLALSYTQANDEHTSKIL